MRRGRGAHAPRYMEALLSLSGPLVVLGIWEFLSRTEIIDSRFWPAPTTLIDTLSEQISSGDLFTNVRISLVRILIGFVIAAIPGVVVGLAMGLYWPIRVFLMPVATAIYAIPKLAVLPLTIIVFGVGESSKVAIVVVSIFFLIVLNTMSGVIAIDPMYRDVAQNMGASRWQMFTTVAWPGALPAIFTGFRLAIGFSLLVIVGTEFLDGNKRDPNGIGWYIIRSWNLLKIEDLFVGLLVIALLAWILNVLLEMIERRLLPWRADV
jgi:NitT/TauT family transport system permease protein